MKGIIVVVTAVAFAMALVFGSPNPALAEDTPGVPIVENPVNQDGPYRESCPCGDLTTWKPRHRCAEAPEDAPRTRTWTPRESRPAPEDWSSRWTRTAGWLFMRYYSAVRPW